MTDWREVAEEFEWDPRDPNYVGVRKMAEEIERLRAVAYRQATILSEERGYSEKLRQFLRDAVNDLEFYSQARRDTSFEGWQLEWRYIPIKHESDYEFFPNHIPLETLTPYKEVLALLRPGDK